MTALDGRPTRHENTLTQYLGAGVFLLGLVVFAVGALSVLAGLFGESTALGNGLLVATTVTAVCVVVVVLALVWLSADRLEYGTVGGAIGLSTAGVASLWVLAPAGWSGGVSAALLAAGGLYAVGVLLLTTSFFTAVLDRQSTTGTRKAGAESYSRNRPGAGAMTTADGGEDDEELEFLLDDDSE